MCEESASLVYICSTRIRGVRPQELRRVNEIVEQERAVAAKFCVVRHQSMMMGEMTTYTNSPNPITCNREIGHTSFSQPSPKLMIQILRVRHVSVRLRAVALTCRVTLSPKKLNKLILIAMATPLQRTVGVLSI